MARKAKSNRPKPSSHANFNLHDAPLEIPKQRAKDLHALAEKFLAPQYQELYPEPSESEDENAASGNFSFSEGSEAHNQSEEPEPPRRRRRVEGNAAVAQNGASDEEAGSDGVPDIEDESMMIYANETSTKRGLSVGRLIGIDDEQKLVEVQRFGSYSKSNKAAKYFPAWTDPKDNKQIFIR